MSESTRAGTVLTAVVCTAVAVRLFGVGAAEQEAQRLRSPKRA